MRSKKESTPKKRAMVRRIKLSFTLLAVILGIFAYHYLTEYYPASETACNALEDGMENGHIYYSSQNGKNIIFKSETDTEVGILFYPGGKVDYVAYTPLLEGLREEGYDVVLMKMPFNLAFFDMNAGDEVISEMKQELPNIKHWFVLGHSLGGVAASKFAAQFPGEVDGLMLLGAYDYGGYDPTNTLVIYGSNDHNLDLAKIDFDKNEVYCIEGGNHAWFGDYGKQEGDGEALLSHKQQQELATYKITEWMENHDSIVSK